MIKHLALLLLTLLFFPNLCPAEMKQLSEEKLSQVTGRAGITIVTDTRISFYADTIAISDTDSDPINWIRFNEFSVDDGNGQGFKISNIDSDPFMLDAGTTADGRTLVQFNLTPFANPISFHVQALEFCDTPIGSLDLNDVELSSQSLMRISTHLDGSSGVEFDVNLGLNIGSFDYTVNTADEIFSIAGIHVGETDSGTSQDPSSWNMTGLFTLGNLDTSPAAIDIGTNSEGNTSLILSLPFSGSVRIEDISMGGTSFGPAVFDDITAHRLTISLSP